MPVDPSRSNRRQVLSFCDDRRLTSGERRVLQHRCQARSKTRGSLW